LAIRGINEMINGGDSHYSFCGTLSYMAPEMIQGIGHGKAVDWWSLGVLLYKMLTGELPFDSKHRKELFDMIINKPIEYPKILSKNAKKIISGLLCRDVKKRLGSGPTDAEEIKNHIFYKKIDWINLEKRKLKPPIELDKNKISVNYFDPKITRQEPIIKSVIMNSNENDIFSELQQHQNSFLGFTFPSSEIETNIKILN
jgi:serine/threonine protein kinase